MTRVQLPALGTPAAPTPSSAVGASGQAGRLRVLSFVPRDTRPLRWFQVWRALRFAGRVKWGD